MVGMRRRPASLEGSCSVQLSYGRLRRPSQSRGKMQACAARVHPDVPESRNMRGGAPRKEISRACPTGRSDMAEGFIRTASDYPSYRVVGERIAVAASAAETGGLELFHQKGEAGQGPPPHAHPWDETFLVVKGEVEIGVGEKSALCGPGRSRPCAGRDLPLVPLRDRRRDGVGDLVRGRRRLLRRRRPLDRRFGRHRAGAAGRAPPRPQRAGAVATRGGDRDPAAQSRLRP